MQRHVVLRLLLVTGLCAVLGAFPSTTSAHALRPAHATLTHADPGLDAVLNTAPTTVTLQFAEAMVPASSTITVYDVKGTVVSTGPTTIAAGDLKTMHVAMKGNNSEAYVVVWRNVSADDGDPDTGAYGFTVSKDAQASAGHQPGQTAASTTTASAGVAPWLTVLLVLLALAAGGAGGYWYAQRRPRTENSGSMPRS
jgi:methionine-rich copper-binding protein CopC